MLFVSHLLLLRQKTFLLNWIEIVFERKRHTKRECERDVKNGLIDEPHTYIFEQKFFDFLSNLYKFLHTKMTVKNPKKNCHGFAKSAENKFVIDQMRGFLNVWNEFGTGLPLPMKKTTIFVLPSIFSVKPRKHMVKKWFSGYNITNRLNQVL